MHRHDILNNTHKSLEMKRLTTLAFMVPFMLLLSCNRKAETDSKDIAEERNEQKFEDSDAEKDTEFAVEAADGGMLEVQLGQLAVSNASSPQVKQFGQMMVDEHSKANEELKTLAAEKKITLPAQLSEKSMKKYNDLAQKSGSDFDKEYIDFMIKDHKEDIELFKKEADNGKDMGLASWASGKIPVLQHHLQLAESAEETVKNAEKRN